MTQTLVSCIFDIRRKSNKIKDLVILPGNCLEITILFKDAFSLRQETKTKKKAEL